MCDLFKSYIFLALPCVEDGIKFIKRNWFPLQQHELSYNIYASSAFTVINFHMNISPLKHDNFLTNGAAVL